MSLGRKKREKQEAMWVETASLRTSGGHPFYERLNEILDSGKFDDVAEESCKSFYSSTGRPGLAPGVYFRLLMVGYFEGSIQSVESHGGRRIPLLCASSSGWSCTRTRRTTRRSRERGG